MVQYTELYIGKSVEELDSLIPNGLDHTNFTTFTQCMAALEKLYQAGSSCALDQEKSYILFSRFLFVYKHYTSRKPGDKEFLDTFYQTKYKQVNERLLMVKSTLEKRFRECAKSQPAPDRIEAATTESGDEKKKRVFNHARSEEDFLESHIAMGTVINIPDNIILPGISAHILTNKLSPESKAIWQKRDQYDCLVLMDWNALPEKLDSLKIGFLRAAIVDWDPNRKYKEPPVILHEGYMSLLESYPTLCTNPTVLLKQKNNELDDLLNLDEVHYPIDNDTTSNVMGEKPPPDAPAAAESDDAVALAVELARLQRRLHDERERGAAAERALAALDRRGADDVEREVIDFRLSKAEAERKRCEDGAAELAQRVERVSARLAALEDAREEVSKRVEAERKEAMVQARRTKPRAQAEGMGVPAVNRATKPGAPKISITELSNLKPFPSGLFNHKNNCYMNTMVQAFGALPPLRDLVLHGRLSGHEIQLPTGILIETVDLLRQLWTTPTEKLRAVEFYNKVVALAPMYGNAQHEDTMEFYLFLINQLVEDCSYNLKRPDVLTTRQVAWYDQFQGKKSPFVDLFYHQLRVQQTCTNCNKKTFKFEIDNTLMLSIPSELEKFSLKRIVDDYMAFSTSNAYVCTQCKKPIDNYKKFVYQPKIFVIVLKRYRHDGKLGLKKIESLCKFPLKNFEIGDVVYDLNAVALHSGTLEFGHYTALCLSSASGKWYQANDDRIILIEDMTTPKIESQATAFFYCRRDK